MLEVGVKQRLFDRTLDKRLCSMSPVSVREDRLDDLEAYRVGLEAAERLKRGLAALDADIEAYMRLDSEPVAQAVCRALARVRDAFGVP